jgi:hypothetical protein
MRKIYLSLIIVPILLAMGGCATTLNVPELDDIKSGNSESGIALVSVGRQNKPGVFLGGYPFVDYKIYRLTEEGTIDGPMAKYVEGEPYNDAMTNPSGHVGKGSYVFVHLFELPEGEYVIKADERGARTTGFMVPGGGFVYMPGTPNTETGNAFLFRIERGKLNYLGEFLTVCEDIGSLACIEINDEFQRDFEFALKKERGIENIEVIHVNPKKVEYTITIKK